MREVTVVIPNYNGAKYLLPCLQALYGHTRTGMDVIVVDNGSKDNTIRDAKEAFPQVKYILLDENYGFCRAVNEGIRAADTEYVILLNNDTEILDGFVEHLLRAIRRSPRIFSVEARMLRYDDPDKLDSAGTYYNAMGWGVCQRQGCVGRKSIQGLQEPLPRAAGPRSTGRLSLRRSDILTRGISPIWKTLTWDTGRGSMAM